MRKFYVWLMMVFYFSIGANAQPGQLSLQTFASGFTDPLYVTHAGDERIFVVEQDGKIKIVSQSGTTNPTPFLNIDPRVNSNASERGLLGLAFHPNYKQNGYFFVNYTNSAGSTVVSRFSVTSNPDVADPNSEQILLTITQPYSNHNGGCIKFGPDGYLYIGMGDGGSGGDPGDRGQDPLELLGKMLRIDVDQGLPYTIPPSNPYVGMSSVRNEIWGFGLRNPWRFSFDKVEGDMWIGDVGQGDEEEIDYWAATNTAFPNFGWRCYEGFAPYNTSGCQPQSTYDDPIYSFSHASGNCSVTGGYVYRGARYGNLWGQYIFTDYCGGYLWWTAPDGMGGWTTTRSNSALSAYNLVSFGEDAYGEMYLAGLSTGIVYRLRDTTCTPHAYIPGGDTVHVCQPGGMLTAFGGPTLDYQWQLSGMDISGATSAALSPSVIGDYRVIVSNGSCVDTSNVVHVLFGTAPTVTLTLPDTMYCDNASPVSVMTSPLGGILSGPGASGVFFDPSAAGVGTHSLVYFYTDPQSGCASSDTFEVAVTVCVGVAPKQIQALQISPNPNSGQFELSFALHNPSDYSLDVLDMQGRRLHGLQFSAASGLVTKTLDFQDLAVGIYFLRVRAEGESSFVKFVISR